MDNVINYLDTTREIIKDGMVIKSPYVSVLQHSRYATSRNENNGEKIVDKKQGSWLGTVGYMIVLDHVGNKFNILENEKKIEAERDKIDEIIEKAIK